MSTDELDRFLVERATELIESDQALSIDDLRVEATAGVVQLSGAATSKSDAERAALLASSVKGCVTVANDIRVKGPVDDADAPAGPSSAGRAPDGWVEGFR